jgi:hypothetical protein
VNERTSIAFLSKGSELLSIYGNVAAPSRTGTYIRFKDLSQRGREDRNAGSLEHTLAATTAHLVYSASSQYLAIATSENNICIWREQYNGEFQQYALLTGIAQSTIVALQLRTSSAAGTTDYTCVILLALYNDGQVYHLHTYDILTQQRIREPITVACSHGSDTHVLVDISNSIDCVVSATQGASMVQFINPLTCDSPITRRF